MDGHTHRAIRDGAFGVASRKTSLENDAQTRYELAMLTLKTFGRLATVTGLSAGWMLACSGAAFNATGGGGGSAGSGNAAGTGTAATGGASAGSANAGASSGGTSHGGASHGGTSSGGTSSGGTSNGGAGGGTVRNSGDCNIDKDCGSGATRCVELSLGGFRTCVTPVPASTQCTGEDVCCPTDPNRSCASGVQCVLGPLAPSCGGPAQIPSNVCAVPACKLNSDCTGNNALCVPAGALDRKANLCLTGGCRRDEQCTAALGGKCESVTPACCGAPSGLYCVYPVTGCRTNADCPQGHCEISGNNAICVAGAAKCAL